MKLNMLPSAVLALTLVACGGGGGGDAPNPPPSAAPSLTGSIVREDNGVIYVTNAATGAETSFQAIPFNKGGVSVSKTGIIAHLQERELNPEGVVVRLTRLDGSIVREFTYAQNLSFVTNRGGARISPDGKWVAFAMNTDIGAAGRADRTYVCNTEGTLSCSFWDYNDDPGWTADNRLLAVDENGTQIYRSNAVLSTNPADNRLDAIGPSNLQGAQSPEGTPDGNGIVFSTGNALPRVFGLNLSSGAVTSLLSDGLSQDLPLAVADSLLYLQPCCANRNGGGTTAGILSHTVHRIPLNLNTTVSSPTGYINEPGLYLQGAGGKLRTVERYGYTPVTR
jgi:hypothetical protein